MILNPNNQMSFHLELKLRKRLLARLLFARNLESDPLPNATSDLEQMRINANAAADHSDTSNPGFPLDSSLKKVFINTNKACPKRNRANPNDHESLLRKGTAGFAHDVRRISCSRCSKERGSHVCNGSMINDNETVKKNGECWKPLQELFDFALEVTEKTYRDYAHGFSKEIQVEIAFKTTPSESKVEPKTEFLDKQRSNSHCSVANIGLPIEEFKSGNYFELLYDLFHEIMVHSLQSILSSDKRTAFGEGCSFNEGLVDAIAYHILEKLLDDPSNLPSNIKPFAKRFRQQALYLHNKRHNHMLPTDKGSERLAINARLRGKESFDFLLKMRGDTWLFKLALSLNLADFSRADRENFVSLIWKVSRVIDQGYSEARAPLPEKPENDKLLNALDNYVDTGDINELRSSMEEVRS